MLSAKPGVTGLTVTPIHPQGSFAACSTTFSGAIRAYVMAHDVA
jgi:hypothetical protein